MILYRLNHNDIQATTTLTDFQNNDLDYFFDNCTHDYYYQFHEWSNWMSQFFSYNYLVSNKAKDSICVQCSDKVFLYHEVEDIFLLNQVENSQDENNSCLTSYRECKGCDSGCPKMQCSQDKLVEYEAKKQKMIDYMEEPVTIEERRLNWGKANHPYTFKEDRHHDQQTLMIDKVGV